MHFCARHTARNVGSGRVMVKIGMTYVRDGVGIGGVLMRIYVLRRDQWLKLLNEPAK